jgi:4-hydroxybenzoate polyprenyltransferase
MTQVTPLGPRPLWWEANEQSGSQIALLATALALTSAATDLMINSRLTLLFDLFFVAICAYSAWRVKPTEFFTIGVLPPLLMLLTVVAVGASNQVAVGGELEDSLLQTTVTGIAHHSWSLGLGYFLAFGLLIARARVVPR